MGSSLLISAPPLTQLLYHTPGVGNRRLWTHMWLFSLPVVAPFGFGLDKSPVHLWLNICMHLYVFSQAKNSIS